MHLLKCDYSSENATQLEIRLCERHYVGEVPYAILSHRWGHSEDEVTYEDMKRGNQAWRKKKAHHKIDSCCRQALQDGLSYVWIDTCCINKDSSAELSEAINSMYEWYKNSCLCYAYLEDVPHDEDYTSQNSSFRLSQWFTRGWTLQELIAPSRIRFFTRGWIEIGEKSQMTEVIREITKVPESVLLNSLEVFDVCISQKMYWAAHRRTTRVEDRAYSMLGLFDLNIPVLYGEGNRAFRRLQEELLKNTFDHTIFAWQLTEPGSGFLAPSPDAFAMSGKVERLPLGYFHNVCGFQNARIDYAMKNLGLEISLPYSPVDRHCHLYTVLLACCVDSNPDPLCLYVRKSQEGLNNHFFRTRISSGSMGIATGFSRDVLFRILYSVKQDLLIVEPRPSWQRAIRNLPAEKLFFKDFSDRKTWGIYKIKLRVESLWEFGCVQVVNAYPMPVCIRKPRDEETKVTVETEGEIVWVIRLLTLSGLEMKVLMTVIDQNLVCHIDATDELSVNYYANGRSTRSIIDFYERCRQSTERPCTACIISFTDRATGEDKKDNSEIDSSDSEDTAGQDDASSSTSFRNYKGMKVVAHLVQRHIFDNDYPKKCFDVKLFVMELGRWQKLMGDDIASHEKRKTKALSGSSGIGEIALNNNGPNWGSRALTSNVGVILPDTFHDDWAETAILDGTESENEKPQRSLQDILSRCKSIDSHLFEVYDYSQDEIRRECFLDTHIP